MIFSDQNKASLHPLQWPTEYNKTHFDNLFAFLNAYKKVTSVVLWVKLDPVVIMGCLCREKHSKCCQTIMNNKSYKKQK